MTHQYMEIKIEELEKRIKALEQAKENKGEWKNGICDKCGYDWGKAAPIASVPNFCPNCGEAKCLDCLLTEKTIIKDSITNGEVVQALFPNIDKIFSNIIDLNLWWNAKYKADKED